MKKKILILCPFPKGQAAGQRLKYEQYFEHWEKEGYEITLSSFSDLRLWEVLYKEGYFLRKAFGGLRGYLRRIRDLFFLNKFDLVYIFMWVTPYGSTFFERIVRQFSKKVIYDFDDSIHLDNTKEEFSISNIFKGNKKSNYLIRSSDHVIISSPFHFDYCIDLNKKQKCTYIPCSLDTERFKLKLENEPKEKIVIGWTGTFSSIMYLDTLKDVLKELSLKNDFLLKIIGNFNYSLEGVDLEVIQWTKENEINDLHSFDIGIYPLIKDQWALGKGALKAMQYMAIGIPTVATNYGTNPQVIDQGINGFLVNSKEEWLDKLEHLILNPEERTRIGLNAREKIERNYSVESLKGTYLEVFKDSEDS